MANASKEAPSQVIEGKPKLLSKEDLVLTQVFDADKKYMFELAVKNPERELPVIDMVTKKPLQHREYNPFRNIVFTSQIVWNGKGFLSQAMWTGGRRTIRYYDGCESIFVDEQPKDKEVIDQVIKQTRSRNFLNGKFGCYGDERMLLIYLNICSWNGESEFKTRTSDTVFVPSNKDKLISSESDRLDRQEQALQLAKDATETKMLIHANFLGISAIDSDSGNELTALEIRTKYRKMALMESAHFIESYGNKAIEIKYYIDKALEQGLISNKFNPNKATWSRSNSEICDISGLRTYEAISEKLLEFSQLEEGAEFMVQLKALYSN